MDYGAVRSVGCAAGGDWTGHPARLTFKVKAHDGVDLIGEGRHQRFVVAWDKFHARVAEKAKAAAVMV